MMTSIASSCLRLVCQTALPRLDGELRLAGHKACRGSSGCLGCAISDGRSAGYSFPGFIHRTVWRWNSIDDWLPDAWLEILGVVVLDLDRWVRT
jgi:hypothetical protein